MKAGQGDYPGLSAAAAEYPRFSILGGRSRRRGTGAVTLI